MNVSIMATGMARLNEQRRRIEEDYAEAVVAGRRPAVATHEAGHAVVAEHHGIAVEEVRAHPWGGGETSFLTAAPTPMALLETLVAGEVGEALAFDGHVSEMGCEPDREQARKLALDMAKGDEAGAVIFLQRARTHAKRILRERWESDLEPLVSQLVDEGVIRNPRLIDRG